MKLFVALLLQYQPLFILGIDDYDVARGSAWGALIMFVTTFVIAIISVKAVDRRDRLRHLLEQQTYDQLPPLANVDFGFDGGFVPDLPPSVTEGVYA